MNEFVEMSNKIDTCENFALRAGTTFLVCGSSGSSKTTTICKIIENFEQATNDTSYINDVHIWYAFIVCSIWCVVYVT